jgi:HAD superfamily hydrolase (TIGR01509 family)
VKERYDRIGLLPGVRAFLAALQDRGIPHGIASNSPRAFVGGALAHLGLAVPAVVCGDEVSRGKPHPAIFWDCANRLGVPSTERAGVCVYEDSAHGLHAAKSAGMIPLGVGTGR